MAVGKGSMARASKAASKKVDTSVNVNEKAEDVIMEKEVRLKESQPVSKKGTSSKTTTKKTAAKKSSVKAEKVTKDASSTVIESASEQVMKQIIYQKSSQVLDREAKVNETFGVGEAMPIYFF